MIYQLHVIMLSIIILLNKLLLMIHVSNNRNLNKFYYLLVTIYLIIQVIWQIFK